MNRFVLTGLAFVLVLSTCVPSRALIFQFDGETDNTFLTAENWDDFAGGPDAIPGASDRAIINDGFNVTYGLGPEQGVSTILGSLIVGADWPVTGDLGTPGTLTMHSGKITVTGGGDNFQLGRACCSGDGTLNLIGNSELEIGGSDPIVGTRDNAVLDVGGSAKVYNTPGVDNYWRLGNYGPSIDAGLEGNGLLNVHDDGSFNAHVIFVADNDSTGEIRVSDNGSVELTGNLVPRPSGFQAGGSAKIQMNGANATLSAYNLESESLAGEVPTVYEFNADASFGLSTITLVDAINITNNDLVVNLNGFELPPLGTVVLFDGDQTLAGDRIFGAFASTTINGSSNPYQVVFDQVNGDILLQRVPEPTTWVLLGLGLLSASYARRRNTN